MELIDVFDANLVLIGSEERNKAHFDAQWHKTFHCWIISSENKGKILFQSRTASVDFPHCLDISAAGHILAGENIDDGIREAQEELGINIDISDMFTLGYRVEVQDLSNGKKNREYQSVYMAKINLPLEEYNPQIEEVAGLYWLNLIDALKLFSGNQDEADIVGIRYDDRTNTYLKHERHVLISDFLPRIQNYYLTIAIMAERLLSGNNVISIS
jgi:isopentenyldiphosphate isomerase